MIPPTYLIASWLIEHYGLIDPVNIEPLTTGQNNQSFLVKSGEDSYVLKWYQNVGSNQRLAFEHSLLNSLGEMVLPFAVPVPVSTTMGDTDLVVRDQDDIFHISLSRRIPGRPARFGALDEAYLCGGALADLDQALATVALNADLAVPETFGDMARVHPLVPQSD
jgi:Ser/Thr protein kinase RdoA (MazF antagonist)